MKLYLIIHFGEKGGEVMEKEGGGGRKTRRRRGRKAAEFLGDGRRRRSGGQILEQRSLATANNRRHVICFHLLFSSFFLPSFRSQPFLFVWFFFPFSSFSRSNPSLICFLSETKQKKSNTSDLLPHLNRSNNPESDSNGPIRLTRGLINELIGPCMSFSS